MKIETILAIFSFAFSFGGLIYNIISKPTQKEKVVVLTVVFALLIATTGVAMYQYHQHNKLVSQVEKEIVAKLNGKTLTFDQLYQELPFRSFQLVNEALFHAVERGAIRDRVILVIVNDLMQQVRVYYVESPQ